MRKSDAKKPAPRRKKTNAEISRINKQAEAAKQAEKKDKQLSWDELAAVDQDCRGMLALPGRVTPLLRDGELIKKVKSTAALTRVSKILLDDIKKYRKALDNIQKQWEGKSGGAVDPDDYLTAIVIFENYDNWINSWNSVVMPNLIYIIDMFNDVLPQEEKLSV